MLSHFLRAVIIQRKPIQCPAGLAGQGETPQTRSGEEAHRPPAESEVPGAQINRLILHSLQFKPLPYKYHS
jgi:hypothetical protein